MRSKKFLRAEQSALDWDTPGLMAGVDEAGRGPLAGPVFEGLAGCHLSPSEEVPVSSSSFTKDLLIVENAG